MKQQQDEHGRIQVVLITCEVNDKMSKARQLLEAVGITIIKTIICV